MTKNETNVWVRFSKYRDAVSFLEKVNSTFEPSDLPGTTFWQIDTSVMLDSRSSKWGSDFDFPSDIRNYISGLQNDPGMRLKASNFLRTLLGDLPKSVFIVLLVFSRHTDVNPIIRQFGGSSLEIEASDDAKVNFTILSCFMFSGDLKAAAKAKFRWIDGA